MKIFPAVIILAILFFSPGFTSSGSVNFAPEGKPAGFPDTVGDEGFFMAGPSPVIMIAAKEDRENVVRKGREAFMHHCNTCHPGGGAGLGPSIINKPLPGFLIKFQVRQGIGVMPAFNKQIIPPEKLDAIVEFLKEK